jgi:hypothetical protein
MSGGKSEIHSLIKLRPSDVHEAMTCTLKIQTQYNYKTSGDNEETYADSFCAFQWSDCCGSTCIFFSETAE